MKKDKYNYCCEQQYLYNPSDGTYADTDPASANHNVCRPLRRLDRAVVKDNMSNNGEFVARLDSAFRYKLAQIGTLDKCIASSKAFSSTYDYYVLKPQDSVKYDESVHAQFTVKQLKRALDPDSNYSLMTHMTRELDEWTKMYYSPCLAALYGMNLRTKDKTTSDVEDKYFMAYPWYSHTECSYISCLSNNMRWDRVNGGCVPSIVTGATATNAYTGTESKCSIDIESNACEHSNSALTSMYTKVQNCHAGQPGSIDFIMDNFCMPQLTGTKLTTAEQSTLTTNLGAGIGANC